MTEPSARGLRLYQGQGPNSFRVRILLAEKDITLSMTEVKFENGDHRKPKFLQLNSLGQIPVLQLENGTIITESVAISRYLDELFPQPQLFGASAIERARVDMWNRRVEFEIFGTIGNVVFHSIPFFAHKLTQFPAFAETEREHLPRKWAWLDGELQDGRPFLSGEKFSVADISGAVAAWIAGQFGMDVPADLKNVQAWLHRVQSRPSWKTAEVGPGFVLTHARDAIVVGCAGRHSSLRQRHGFRLLTEGCQARFCGWGRAAIVAIVVFRQVPASKGSPADPLHQPLKCPPVGGVRSPAASAARQARAYRSASSRCRHGQAASARREVGAARQQVRRKGMAKHMRRQL